MKILKFFNVIIPLIFFFTGIFSAYSENEPTLPDNTYCLRCHGMKTLSYIEESTGVIKNLFVDSIKFNHSNHQKLKCAVCHDKGFDIYPHNFSLETKKLQCTKCHKDDPKFDKFHFNEVEKEFYNSVHYKNLKDKFDCYSCHDPHKFEISQGNKSIEDAIKTDNEICLKCHKSTLAFSNLSDKKYIDLEIAHSWLPNLEIHWKTVMCIDCHTPTTNDISHQSHEIVGADKAEKNCVSCHSTNSILMTKLYKYQTKQSNQKNGFINSRALNEAYTIGMTRNIYLDKLSILIAVLTLAGIFIHAFGIWIGKKARQKNK
ncbi:MAG: hypothetical protein GXO79_09595 [Chlorobi bacterium]|nr:hypothetical protein [Chlorobiota bacterium]